MVSNVPKGVLFSFFENRKLFDKAYVILKTIIFKISCFDDIMGICMQEEKEKVSRKIKQNGEIFSVMLSPDVAKKLRGLKEKYGIYYSAFIKLAVADEIAKLEANGELLKLASLRGGEEE